MYMYTLMDAAIRLATTPVFALPFVDLGPSGSDVGQALVVPPVPLWAPWALVGWALAGQPLAGPDEFLWALVAQAHWAFAGPPGLS